MDMEGFSRLGEGVSFAQCWQKARKRLLREDEKRPAKVYFRELVREADEAGLRQSSSGPSTAHLEAAPLTSAATAHVEAALVTAPLAAAPMTSTSP